jgi:hypothetical protein
VPGGSSRLQRLWPIVRVRPEVSSRSFATAVGQDWQFVVRIFPAVFVEIFGDYRSGYVVDSVAPSE